MKKALLAAGMTIMCIVVFIIMPYCLLKSSFEDGRAADYKNITSHVQHTAWLSHTP